MDRRNGLTGTVASGVLIAPATDGPKSSMRL